MPEARDQVRERALPGQSRVGGFRRAAGKEFAGGLLPDANSQVKGLGEGTVTPEQEPPAAQGSQVEGE